MKNRNRIKRRVLCLMIMTAVALMPLCCCKNKNGQRSGRDSVSDNLRKNSDRKTGTNKVTGSRIRAAGKSRAFEGTYSIRVADFKGVLIFVSREGQYHGTLRFLNWGRGVAEPLKNIKINGNKIYFERSILTSEEMDKIGSTRYFNQKFYGHLSEDGSVIKGYYIDSGAETSWKATR